MFIAVLNAIGVFAFAYCSAAAVLSTKYSSKLTAALCAFLTAFGGGMIREWSLGNVPSFVHHPWLLAICLMGYCTAIVGRRYASRLENSALLLDAVGLVTFAYIGAMRAQQYNLNFATGVCFALLTSAGGGVLAVLITKRPVLRAETAIYMLPAIVVAGLCYGHPNNSVVGINQLHLAAILSAGYLVRFLTLVVYRYGVFGEIPIRRRVA